MRRALLAVGAFLLPLLLLEGGARLFLAPPPANVFPGVPESTEEHAELLWRHRPGYRGGETDGPINSLGFRGEEIALEKDPGTFRILSLGESTTFGQGLGWRQSYSHLLEERLRAAGYEVQVLNAGVQAWSTYQSARYLELELDRLRPDLVIAYHEINDFLPTAFRGIELRGAGLNDLEVVEHLRRPGPVRWILERSRFLTAVRVGLARREAAAALREIEGREDRDALLAVYGIYDSLPPAAAGERPWMDNRNRFCRLPDPEREAALRRLVELTRQAGVELLLIHPAYSMSRPHRCLLNRVAEESAVPVLEAEDLFLAAAASDGRAKKDLFQKGDIFHPSAEGHELLSEALAELVLARGLIPERYRTAADPGSA